jgi:hypothetical protein
VVRYIPALDELLKLRFADIVDSKAPGGSLVSGIVWLSSSSAEIRRARNVLKALTPGGVIDELGFLILNSAFADRFYPAVTTPMTRARYFFFVPAIYQYIERSGRGVRHDVDLLSRRLQHQLLKTIDAERGAIGKQSGFGILRPPSEIYWGALAVLGFATQRTSLDSYHRQLSEGLFKPQALRDDDKAVHLGQVDSFWASSLRLSYLLNEADPDAIFPSDTTLRLRKSEAVLLRQRYEALLSNGHSSLITHMVDLSKRDSRSQLSEFRWPWDIPALPRHTADVVQHARRLSMFSRGTTLQYYRMLIEKKGVDDEGAAEAFDAWWEPAHEDLRSWNLDAFFHVIDSWGANRRPAQDRAFLRDWIARCVSARSGRQALDDAEARRIVAGREGQVRRGKERLHVKYQLDSWEQPPSGYRPGLVYQLDYRHSVGRQFAQDIADGLSRGVS